MKWKYIRQRIRYYLQFNPFTLNTGICALAAWLGYRLLYRPLPKAGMDTEDDSTASAFRPFVMLLGKMALLLLLALVLISILSTIATWLYYIYLKNSRGAALQVAFTTETKTGRKNKLYLNAVIDSARRPLLGFIKGRLYYDDYRLTDKFSLLSNKRSEGGFLRKAIGGRSRLMLPDIKEYDLRGGFVFFEDMLHLFSLAVPQKIAGQFYQPPVLRNEEDRDVAPRKTETLDVRIDQMRKVEGEYLSYKNFEAGDDIRRIVWKVYAKSRDFVVRQPERFEPYASHLYFYASFYASLNKAWLDDGYGQEMLNYYKNSIWTVYDTLARKEWEMRYLPDQSFSIPENLGAGERATRIISNSTWQTDTPLSGYFNARQGTVLCISSFTDPHDLENILEQCDSGTILYFAKCSSVFHHFAPFTWIKRILFLPPNDRLAKLRTRWTFSPIRIKVLRNERLISNILSQSEVSSIIL